MLFYQLAKYVESGKFRAEKINPVFSPKLGDYKLRFKKKKNCGWVILYIVCFFFSFYFLCSKHHSRDSKNVW
jgi:hypothetical protein